MCSFARGHARVGAGNEVAGKHLGRFHRPKSGTIERAQTRVIAMFLDRIVHSVGENDCVLASNDLVQCDQLLGADKRTRAIVDEHVLDIGGQGGERVAHGILPLASPVHEDGRCWRVRRKFKHLPLIAIDHNEEVGDSALHERGCGVTEHRPTSERGKDLVINGALHA
jgi:hypothetical protein